MIAGKLESSLCSSVVNTNTDIASADTVFFLRVRCKDTSTQYRTHTLDISILIMFDDVIIVRGDGSKVELLEL